MKPSVSVYVSSCTQHLTESSELLCFIHLPAPLMFSSIVAHKVGQNWHKTDVIPLVFQKNHKKLPDAICGIGKFPC